MLKEKLQGIGYQSNAEIMVPFFKEDTMLSDLPADLKKALEDAITLQTREDINIDPVTNEAKKEMDKQMCAVISNNQAYIDGLTVSLEESKSVFVSELSRVIASLPNKLLRSGLKKSVGSAAVPGTIKIASLDVDYDTVHAEIRRLRANHLEVDDYFATRDEHKGNDENDKSQNRFITSVHCTFAHASQLSQSTMIASFQHLLGTSIDVKATSLLFTDKIAAIELDIPTTGGAQGSSSSSAIAIPKPRNEFPHITIWCAKDTEAYESNTLSAKVKCNEAKRIIFEKPIAIKGILSFWYY